MFRAATEARRAAIRPREVFERVKRSVLDQDADGFADLFASDGVMEFPLAGAAVGLPDCLEGREQIRLHVSAAMRQARQAGRRPTAYDDLMLHETADPEVIIVEFDLHGELRGAGAYQLPCVQVFRIRDGAIVWFRDYFASNQLPATVAPRDRRVAPGSELDLEDPALGADQPAGA